MAQNKFFSGLPQRMDARAGHGPNRLKTQFFWPADENTPKLEPRTRKLSRSSSKDSGAWDASNYETDSASVIVKSRRNNQMQSKIEFYDTMDDENNNNNHKNGKRNDNKNDPPPPSAEPIPIRVKKQQTMESKIEFYDYMNDEETAKKEQNRKQQQTAIPQRQLSYEETQYKVETNRSATPNKSDPKKEGSVRSNQSIEHLAERMIDVQLEEAKSPPPRQNEYDSADSEEEYLRERRRAKKPPIRPSYRPDGYEDYDGRRPRVVRRPPRPNYDYEDEYGYPMRPNSRERYERYESAPRSRGYYYDDYDAKPVGRPPMSPRRHPDEYYDDRYYEGPPTPRRNVPEADYEPIDRDYYYEEPSRESLPPTSPKQKQIPNGSATGSARHPVKRAMSICSDAPTEMSRAMSHRHLKSNIFFTDKEALETTPRPRTVRDSATNRVCVGLPDIY